MQSNKQGAHATQAAWEAARETPAGSPTGQDERERTRQHAGIAEGGVTEPRPLGKVENRKLGGAEDRLPQGSPKGAASGTMQVKDCRKAAPKEEQLGGACESAERERTPAR